MPATAIEVSGVRKSFRVPAESYTTLRDTITHPLRARRSRELRALDDVGFEVARGEFFGIVGRNGSGKSTLLKLLASIYRADRGRIRLAGRLAPFIELGVGFNPELPALDNVVLNGVMMGLSRREARRRFDRIVDFAELHEFTGLKLKNYSSGMQVRLAFAVMLEVDADVLLFDEVLAVGDAGFQEKCTRALEELRAGPQTVVLVTHAMPSVQLYCDRAMLLERGRVEAVGQPEDVVGRYLELAVEHELDPAGRDALGLEDGVRVASLTLERAAPSGPAGVSRLAPGAPILARAELEALADHQRLALSFAVLTVSGTRIGAGGPVELELPGGRLGGGERLAVRLRIANPLVAGRYVVRVALARRDGERTVVVGKPAQVAFDVDGEEAAQSGAAALPPPSLVRLEHSVEVER